MSNPTTPKGFLSLITAVFVFSLVVEINVCKLGGLNPSPSGEDFNMI